MKINDDDDDKNGSFDDIFTPLSSSFPRGSVILFLQGFKTWNIIRHFLDDESWKGF